MTKAEWLAVITIVLLNAWIYYRLLGHDDEFEYHDVPPARSNVTLRRGVYDQDGAA